MITVFLADDHAVVRDGLTALLDMQPDIQVVGTAADGRTAVRQVLELRPDVVIMDIAMPEMNGLLALRQILEGAPDTPVVILSMYDDAEQILRALQAGARGYLLKASAGAEVADAVRAVHAGRRYLTDKVSDMVIEGYVRLSEGGALESTLAQLSPREQEVLQLLAEGHSNTEIADKLALATGTVNVYRSRLMRKLGLDDLADLIKFAIRHKLISL